MRTQLERQNGIPDKAEIPATVVRFCIILIGKQALERRQCQVTRPHRRKINQLP
jgi:hypothetical protein